MKKIFLTALFVPAMALAQTFPAPTFSSLTLQNPLSAANGGTGSTSATGTGSAVLSNSPTLTTPNLGTPSAVTLTNGAGLPIATGVSGLGTGVAAGLSNAVTGSGSPVLATSPTISSPTISSPTITGATISSPSISAPTVTGSFTATGLVTTADLATQAANTVLANATGSSASPAAFTMPSCSASTSALQWTAGTGFTCYGSSASLTGATFTGNVAINNSNAQIQVNDSSGTGHSDYYLYSSGSPFWDWRLTGSSGLLQLVRYVSGTLADQPISVSNSTGITTFADGITANGTNTIASPNLTGTATAANLTATGTVSGAGFTNYFASPPAIGGTAANTISATSYSQNIPLTGSSLSGNCSLTVPSTNYCVNYWQIGAASPFDTVSLSDPTAFVNGLTLLHNYGGSSATGGRQTFVVQSTLAAPTSSSNGNRNYVAGVFYGQAASGDGGTGLTSGTAKGGVFALNPIAVAYNGATNLLELTGAEVNIAAQTGSSMFYKAGFTIVQGPSDQVQGSVYDTALGISNQGGQVGWQNGILFGPMNGAFPITSTGCLICSTGSGTAATGIDFSSLTLTNLLKGPGGFKVDGSGNITSTSVSASVGVSAPSLTASSGIALNASNPSLVVNDSSGTNAANILLRNNGTTAWSISNQSPSNAFAIARYVSGTGTDLPLTISNSTGAVTMVDGITGITNGSAAASGIVGQTVTGTGSATVTTSGGITSAASMTLPAGHWMLTCTVAATPTSLTSWGSFGVSVSSSATAFGTGTNLGLAFTPSFGQTMTVGPVFANTSASQTEYCPVALTFSGTSVGLSGTLTAVRIQ